MQACAFFSGLPKVEDSAGGGKESKQVQQLKSKLTHSTSRIISYAKERIVTCLPPNPRRVGYIVPKHGLLDGPLYMGSIYSNRRP